MERARSRGCRVVAHPGERPGQVDAGRARGCEDALGLGRILAAERRERESVRPGDADRRRAPDDHVPNRRGDLGRATTGHVDLLERQPPLVEQHDARVIALLEPEDPRGLELAAHPPTPKLQGSGTDTSVRAGLPIPNPPPSHGVGTIDDEGARKTRAFGSEV